jgi:hypothetical protein
LAHPERLVPAPASGGLPNSPPELDLQTAFDSQRYVKFTGRRLNGWDPGTVTCMASIVDSC